jgi:hypothetical protein
MPYLTDLETEIFYEDTVAQLERIKGYGFKKVVLIPPIIINEEQRRIRGELANMIASMEGIVVMDWNEYFTEDSFTDPYHFTLQFKGKLQEAIHSKVKYHLT